MHRRSHTTPSANEGESSAPGSRSSQDEGRASTLEAIPSSSNPSVSALQAARVQAVKNGLSQSIRTKQVVRWRDLRLVQLKLLQVNVAVPIIGILLCSISLLLQISLYRILSPEWTSIASRALGRIFGATCITAMCALASNLCFLVVFIPDAVLRSRVPKDLLDRCDQDCGSESASSQARTTKPVASSGLERIVWIYLLILVPMHLALLYGLAQIAGSPGLENVLLAVTLNLLLGLQLPHFLRTQDSRHSELRFLEKEVTLLEAEEATPIGDA